MMGKLSIIVVNWNTLEITKKCIDKILTQTKYPFEIILVDNGSTDGSKEYFNSFKNSNFMFISLCKNIGYAAGNNIGIKAASGDYLCLLNSDAFVTKNSLEYLVSCIKKQNAGMVGPLTNKAKGAQCKRIYHRYLTFLPFKPKAVEYLSFFCVMIHKKVIANIGLLDEKFGFGTFEDDDFCKRAKLNGYKLLICQKSWVWHIAHATMKANKIDETKLISTNWEIFHQKWT